MRKLSLFFGIFALIILSASCVFAQIAKIVDVKGDVTVQKEASQPWEKAKVDMFLDKQAEIKTGKDSECTLTFDEELKNILTVKENSHIKIENLKPANIFLPEGRVFSIIDNIAKIEKFEIRTPTAIAGSRGTGSSVGFQESYTLVLCFLDTVYVQGLDEQGNTTGEKDLAGGFGINVGLGGEFGNIFELGASDIEDWDEFTSNIEEIREILEEEEIEDIGDTGSLEDLKQESNQDNTFEQRREEQERRDAQTDTGSLQNQKN